MRETAGSATAPAARWRKFRRGSFILNLPLASHHSITSSAAGEQRLRHGEAECIDCLLVDGQLKFDRLLDWQLGQFRNAEVHISNGLNGKYRGESTNLSSDNILILHYSHAVDGSAAASRKDRPCPPFLTTESIATQSSRTSVAS